MNSEKQECLMPHPPTPLPFRADRFHRVYFSMSPKETICAGCKGVVGPFLTCICRLEQVSNSFSYDHQKENPYA